MRDGERASDSFLLEQEDMRESSADVAHAQIHTHTQNHMSANRPLLVKLNMP